MKDSIQAPFESTDVLISPDPVIDPIQAVQHALAALAPQPGQYITYDQIEAALLAAGLDPYEHGDSYQNLIEKIEHLGALVVDSIAALTEPTVDQEMLSLIEADEVEQRLKPILLDEAWASRVLLTAEEEHRLLEIYADGQLAVRELPHAATDHHKYQIERRVQMGKHAQEELIRRNLRLVAKNVVKYGKRARHLDFDDLLQEGTIGLSRAIERFDLSLNMRLSTYATWWIRQAISRAVADQDRTIRLPVHMVEKIIRLWRIERELEVSLARSPTEAELALEFDHFSPNDGNEIRSCWEHDHPLPNELAQRLDHAIAIVRKLQRFGANEPLSTDLPVKDSESSTLADFIPTSDLDTPEAQIFQISLHEVLIEVMEDLPERTKRILQQRFGFDDGIARTLEEIGQQFNVTRERVRQIEFKALRMLQHPTRARKLIDFLGK